MPRYLFAVDDDENDYEEPFDFVDDLIIDGDDDDDDDDFEPEYLEGGDDEVIEVDPPPPPPPPPLPPPPQNFPSSPEPSNDVFEVEDTEEPSPTPTSKNKAQEEEQEEEEDGKGWNREDVEGLFCPICMEPWTSSGDHQSSCLSCGHLFGMSCIRKWLGQQRSSGKCPQCNKKCKLKDVRRIYGSRVVVVDEESQKRIRFLEAKCDSLRKKDDEWRNKEIDWRMKVLVWQKKEADLLQKLRELNERTNNLERTVWDLESKSKRPIATAGDGFKGDRCKGFKMGLNCSPVSSYSFELLQDLKLDGARYFDVDDAGQILIAARRPTQIGGPCVLTKMSLVSPREQDNMLLPAATKSVRDVHVSPSGKLALLASTGKKLSILSMESNNIVLDYDLPAAAWSCSWDVNSSNFVFAGLQNGMLLIFDLRQTERPLESRNGLTYNPVHFVYSLPEDSLAHTGAKKLLTASSVGLCQWDIGDVHQQPSLISETQNHGVCISAAYCPSNDNIVATFRPKVEKPDSNVISQVSQTPSIMGPHVPGSHVLLKRVDTSYQNLESRCAYVPGIRLPKSTILEMGDGTSLFACGDQPTTNLALQELPSLLDTHNLQSTYPIRDVKYTASVKPSLLCCLSEDRVQFFSQKLL